MRPIVKILSAPDQQPLSLEDIRGHLRIDTNDDDVTLMRLLQAATERVQDLTGLYFLNHTIEESFTCFKSEICLGRGPVQAITSVKYFDQTNSDNTIDPGYYFTENDVLYMLPNFSAPAVRSQGRPLRVVYTAGHIPLNVSGDTLFDDGTDFSDSTGFVGTQYYPEQLKQALRLMVGFYNETREEGLEQRYGGESYTPFSVLSLIQNFKKEYF